jgi:hypothetical protein
VYTEQDLEVSTGIPKSCASLPPADRARCAEDHPWHNHKSNRVVLRYYAGSEDLFYLDGAVEHLKWQAGTVEWSPASGFHFCITDQNVRTTAPEGKAEVTQQKVGDFKWSGPSKQKVDNLSEKPLETVIVKLKTIY